MDEKQTLRLTVKRKNILDALKEKHNLKNNTEAIDYALLLAFDNEKLHEILISNKDQILKLNSKIESYEWRMNEIYELLLKINKGN